MQGPGHCFARNDKHKWVCSIIHKGYGKHEGMNVARPGVDETKYKLSACIILRHEISQFFFLQKSLHNHPVCSPAGFPTSWFNGKSVAVIAGNAISVVFLLCFSSTFDPSCALTFIQTRLAVVSTTAAAATLVLCQGGSPHCSI